MITEIKQEIEDLGGKEGCAICLKKRVCFIYKSLSVFFEQNFPEMPSEERKGRGIHEFKTSRPPVVPDNLAFICSEYDPAKIMYEEV